MIIHRITDVLSVADQLVTSDLRTIADAGFRSVICNRPDEEDEPHEIADEMAKRAIELNLEFRYQPVSGAFITDDDVLTHRDLLDKLPKPILSYCRSGTRCSKLWALTQSPQQDKEYLISTVARAGFKIIDIAHRL